MTPEQAAAFVIAQAAAMLCELEAMKAANAERAQMGTAPAYNAADFSGLPGRFGLGENAVLELFARANHG